MRFLSKLLFLFGLIAFIFSLAGFFNEQQALGYEVQVERDYTAISKEEVLLNLTQLLDVYEFDLDETQIKQITDICQNIIDRDIPALSIQKEDKAEKYNQLISTAQTSLDFIANNQAQMAQDTSSVDALKEELRKIREDFSLALNLYDASLIKLSILGSDCQSQPLAFIAGLKDLFNQRQLVEGIAGNLLDFIEMKFKTTVNQLETEERGLELED